VVKIYHMGKEEKFHIFFVVDQGSLGHFHFQISTTKKVENLKIKMGWVHGQFGKSKSASRLSTKFTLIEGDSPVKVVKFYIAFSNNN